MAFFTLACTRPEAPYVPGKRLRWLAMLVLCLLPLAAAAETAGFRIEHVDTVLEDNVYHLNAEINYRFSNAVLEALHNGVPLTLNMEIVVTRHRWWWFNKTIASLEQRYQLLYHALTKKYLVRNLNSDGQHSYTTLNGALLDLGQIDMLPILDRKFLKHGTTYRGALRVELDIEALPAPLRPLAYLSSQWRLASTWYTWPLQP